MNTRIFTLLIMLLAMMPSVGWGQSVWDGTTTNTDWYGDGSVSVFTINTAEQLAGLAELVNEGNSFDGKTIKLGNNIILNEGVLNANKELNSGNFNTWTPISGFCGTFDGQGHTISGVYIIGNDDNSVEFHGYGLFTGALGGDDKFVEIKNVGVVDSYIKGNKNSIVAGICAELGTSFNSDVPDFFITRCYFDGLLEAESPAYISGICAKGHPVGTKIESCYNLGNLEVSLESGNSLQVYVSGIADAQRIYNCYNVGNITIDINNYSGAGNIISIGGVGSASNIASCYNQGTITVSGNNNNSNFGIGGIAGLSHFDIQYCYNTGTINSSIVNSGTTGIGSIAGIDMSGTSFVKNYYKKTDSEKGIGYNLNSDYTDKKGKIEGVSDFLSGEIAWNMRESITVALKNPSGVLTGETETVTGYGQELTEDGVAIDETPVLLAFSENQGKEVYQLTLNSEVEGITNNSPIYRNAKESNLLSEETYNQIIEGAAEGLDLVWYSGEKVVTSGNIYRVTADETLTAKLEGVYNIITAINPEEAGTIDVKERAANGEEVTFSLEITDGYELVSVTVNEGAVIDENADGVYTFTMPAEDVTLTANFQKAETPTDPDEGDEGDDIHHPQRPIKYYNIYVDTICPGLDVETSKDVVQEGHQVSAYLTIQAECDTTGMRFEYKRGLFGYWQDLKPYEGVQPGEYIIKNIYTDIYIRALDATLPEEEPTGIDDLEGIQAYAKEGSIYVYTPNREEVTIVSMSGAILKHEEQVGWQSYDVNRGIYIVRVGEKVFKLKN